MKRLSCLFFTGMLAFTVSFKPGILAQNIPGTNVVSRASGNTSTLNLADNVISSDSRPILKELFVQAGLLSTLSGNNTYTFFAPTEKALKEIQFDSSEKLRVILLNHVVAGTYKLDDLQDGMKLQTLANETITIFRNKEEILVNGIPVVNGNDVSKNGIMHNIGDVLKPKYAE